MASSIPSRQLVLAFSLLLLLTNSLAHSRYHRRGGSNRYAMRARLSYHGGQLLTGNIDLALIWYGNFEHSTKETIKAFIESINANPGFSQPTVAKWWNTVQNYETVARPRTPATKSYVRVVSELSQPCSLGKILTMDFIPLLVNQAVGGRPNTVAVVFTAEDVAVHGLCTGKCQLHGMLQKTQPYIVVGNSENECPGACLWPFRASHYMPRGKVLPPPSGNAATDSMVVHLAAGLAELITNPANTGFYGGTPYKPVEVTGGKCKNVFGSRALPVFGSPGTVAYSNGKAFNANGINGHKFLLPALWNPRTYSCSTLM